MSEPEILDEAALQRVWRGVHGTRTRRAERRRLARALAVTAVVAATGGWWLGTLTRDEGLSPIAAELEPRAPVEAALAAGREVVLGEGTRVAPGPGAQLVLLELGRDEVVLLLRGGTARLEVSPSAERRYLIECDAVTVEVRDAAATIARVGGRVDVRVERGAALVRGDGVPEHVQRVEAGRALVVERGGAARRDHDARAEASAVVPAIEDARSARPPALASAPAVLPSPEVSPLPAMVSPPPAMVSPLPAMVSPPPAMVSPPPAMVSPRASSSEGARAPPVRPPLAPPLPARAPPAEPAASAPTDAAVHPAVALLARADHARARQEPQAAALLLEEVVTRYADHPAAPLAAFELARLELDVLGRPDRAAWALERALTSSLPAALDEDARARRVEAYARRGDVARARASAADYRARYPRGRRLADVERWSPR